MDLVHGRQLRAGENCSHRQAPVLVDRRALVAAPVPDVETRKLASGNAAAAAEESVRNIVETGGADHFDTHSDFLMMTSSSAWLPTMNA